MAHSEVPASSKSDSANQDALRVERRRQVRGLLFLAMVTVTFSLWRAGVANIFHPGWWRLW